MVGYAIIQAIKFSVDNFRLVHRCLKCKLLVLAGIKLVVGWAVMLALGQAIFIGDVLNSLSFLIQASN